MDQTINGNLSTCIQSANSIGGTTYYNVCNGAIHWVPWGSGDWAAAIALTLVGVAILAGIGLFIYCMVAS